ncbi:MAG TPA: winged helix-turn-helix domain-containing protein [Nitrososphaerales archaeon]|nr:winged helix-turn-helix domain-containing protein [Nitrososphaerales archaeon]
MKRASSKRSKIELYATVLEVIKRYPEGSRITKMSYGVGVPIDRLKTILVDLTSFGLVQTLTDEEEEGIFYTLTPRAFDFLETYWKMKSYLETFGTSRTDSFTF